MAGLGFHLTPFNLEAAYALLLTAPPFRAWRLPPPDQVEFKVSATRERMAGCAKYRYKDQWEIDVSSRFVSTLANLIECMAHEMIHLRQMVRKTETKGVEHNAEFRKLAKQVCARHGFDPKRF